MSKKKIKNKVEQAIENRNLTNFIMDYNENYYNLIPIKMSDKLFLSIRESDFTFDGFRVARFKDVCKVRIKKDLCDKIIIAEGLFENFTIPDVDVTSWQTVLRA